MAQFVFKQNVQFVHQNSVWNLSPPDRIFVHFHKIFGKVLEHPYRSSLDNLTNQLQWPASVCDNKITHLRLLARPTLARVDAYRGRWWRCHSPLPGDSVGLQFAKIVMCIKYLYFYVCRCCPKNQQAPHVMKLDTRMSWFLFPRIGWAESQWVGLKKRS